MERLLASLSVLLLTTAQAQIPNGDFELWNNMGTYLNPVDWATYNDITAPLGGVTCHQGSPGYSGDYYMSLETLVPLGYTGDAVCCGGPLIEGLPSDLRFPLDYCPAYLTGVFRCISNVRMIAVLLTKWDSGTQSRINLGSWTLSVGGIHSTWIPFEMQLWPPSAVAPDSAQIYLTNEGGGFAGEYFDVDALAFEGVAGITGPADPAYSPILFPSPCSGELHVQLPAACAAPLRIEMVNAAGQILLTRSLDDRSSVLDVSALSSGFYTVRIALRDGSFLHQRVMKQ